MTIRKRLGRLARCAVVAGLLPAATLLVLPATPAHALAGSVRESTTTASDSTDFKITVVSCSGGRPLLGLGARVDGGDGTVMLTELRPTGAADGVVSAVEHHPHAGDWSLTAYAVCGPVGRNTFVEMASSLWNSATNRMVTVDCPTGTRVAGTGFQVEFDWDNDVVVESVKPDANLESVTVSAREDAGTANNWRLNAFAVCTAINGPAQRVTFETASNSTSPKGAGRSCPTGMTLTGVGGEIRDGAAQVMLDRLIPGPALEIATARGQEHTPYPDDWSVRVFGSCSQ